jgi:hypothetical protein
MAGLMVEDGVPMSIIVVGRNMYAKVTSAFLAHLGKSGECAALCGKYVIIRGAMAAGLMRSIGGTTTVNILLGMAAPKSALTAATFHGHPAYRWIPTGYAPGAYIIVSKTQGRPSNDREAETPTGMACVGSRRRTHRSRARPASFRLHCPRLLSCGWCGPCGPGITRFMTNK